MTKDTSETVRIMRENVEAAAGYARLHGSRAVLMRLSDTVSIQHIEPARPISIPTPPNKRRDWTPAFVESCAHQGLIEAYPERPDAGPRALVFGVLLSLPIWAVIALVWWLV